MASQQNRFATEPQLQRRFIVFAFLFVSLTAIAANTANAKKTLREHRANRLDLDRTAVGSDPISVLTRLCQLL
jgi:hypothetical protein